MALCGVDRNIQEGEVRPKMREIKFRGWINKLDKWAESVIVHSEGGFYAYYNDIAYVNADLEQYTNKKDKNDKEIYEGDILQGDGISQVIFYDSSWCLKSSSWTFPFLDCAVSECIIIGNIHENPELLESKNAWNEI
jgi:hypothetical protein